jgi:hypothetical protein
MPTFLPSKKYKFLLGYADSCKRKVIISAREIATIHSFKEESPDKRDFSFFTP